MELDDNLKIRFNKKIDDKEVVKDLTKNYVHKVKIIVSSCKPASVDP